MVQEWQGFLEKYEPNTILCVALGGNIQMEYDNSGYLDWCIDNHIEFVDAIETRPPDVDEREKYGIERVLEALENNAWPNMQKKNILKQQPPQTQPPVSADTVQKAPENKKESTPEDELTTIQSPYIPTNFFEALSAPGEDFDFEKVLHTLKGLKDQAAQLPDQERRALAASVALSFAKLLGEEDD